MVIGAQRVPIVVIIGVVSMLYTAYGGLYVSIVTDQWQVCGFCLFRPGSTLALWRFAWSLPILSFGGWSSMCLQCESSATCQQP